MTRALLASALVSGLLLAAALPGCQQPDLYCSTAHGDFAATFKLTKGDAKSACGQLTGDILGVQTYFGTGGLNGTPKYGAATMALRPQKLGDLLDRLIGEEILDQDIALEANAVGAFTTEKANDSDFCAATKFNRVAVDLPSAPEHPSVPKDPPVMDDPMTADVDESMTMYIPPQAATSIAYEWSNARVLVSANYQGTQLSADLKFTQDGCTAEYHVVGVYPVAKCTVDKDCLDPTATSINPDFDLKCDPGLQKCVLVGEPPALN